MSSRAISTFLTALGLLLLSADDPEETDWRRATPIPGKLFVVGDPKQSIYRFRRADVAIYERIKAELASQTAEESSDGAG